MWQATRRQLIVTYAISLGLATACMSLPLPIPSASAQQLIGTVNQGTSGTGTQKKDSITLTNKPHRLIRKPQNAPVASVAPSPSGTSPVSSVPTPPASLQSDNTTSQSTEPSSLNRSVGAALPLATMSVAPSSTTTTRSIAAGTASTGTIPLAAASAGYPSTSGSGDAGSRTLQSLVRQWPWMQQWLAQLLSPPSDPVAPPPPSTPTPAIGLSSTNLSFTGVQGGTSPATQTVTISNNGAGTLSWTGSGSNSWLSVSPASGSVAAGSSNTLSVSASTTGLAGGTVSAPIMISASGATNTPQTITASLTVTAQPALGLSPTTFSFTATQGAANPAPNTLNVTNPGTGTLTWSVTDNASWLTLTPASGTTTTGTNPVTLSVNTLGLLAGPFTAAITVTATAATNSPQTIPVTLTVSAPATSTATLAWDANTEPDLTGYKVYQATASGAYSTTPIATLPNTVTSYVATGLQVGTTYYFVVKSYDTAGNESLPSNEVSKSIF